MILSTLKKALKGFTLTETAIVLGVIGLVLGGIWSAGNAVNRSQQAVDAVTTFTDIATRVRGLVSGNPKMNPASAPLDTIANQIGAGLFPDSAVNPAKNDTVNLWSGNIRLAFKRNSTIISGFTVAFTLPKSWTVKDRNAMCLSVLSKLPANGPTTGGIGAPTGTPPVPSGTIVAEPTQGNEPMYVYLSNGNWAQATNVPVTTLLSNLGAAGCYGIAYYFAL